MLTKDQERHLVAELVNNTPPGYVKDFLVEAAPLWIDGINNDLAEVGLHELWRLKMEGREELNRMHRDIAALEAQKRAVQADLERERAKAQSVIGELRNAILGLERGITNLSKIGK